MSGTVPARGPANTGGRCGRGGGRGGHGGRKYRYRSSGRGGRDQGGRRGYIKYSNTTAV